MDEPCSALDPIATAKIEDLMRDSAHRYTIVIVTRNTCRRPPGSATTPAFFTAEVDGQTDPTRPARRYQPDLHHPGDQRAEDYITCRFG